MASLTTPLKSDAFKWNEDTEVCFKKTKTLMTSTPVLVAPDFYKKIVIECDVLGTG